MVLPVKFKVTCNEPKQYSTDASTNLFDKFDQKWSTFQRCESTYAIHQLLNESVHKVIRENAVRADVVEPLCQSNGP